MDIKEKLNKYLNENLIEEDRCAYMGASACASSFNSLNFNKKAKMAICDEEICEKDISSYIDKELNENKFQKLLFEYIDKKGLKDSDVYNKANIDRRLFSKIRSDDDYHPSKKTIISLASSLELNIDELEKLLDSASYSLPKNNKFDLIIRFCFIEKIYNIMDINNLLMDHKCSLLDN